MGCRLLAVALAALALVAGCSGDDSGEYDAEFQAEFMDTCTERIGGPGAEPVCTCWYDAVSETIAFDRLPAIDDLVGGDLDQGADRQPGQAEDEAQVALATCVRRLDAAPTLPGTTVPPPTLPAPRPPPTTTTTVPA
jgi:hypothetical protein